MGWEWGRSVAWESGVAYVDEKPGRWQGHTICRILCLQVSPSVNPSTQSLSKSCPATISFPAAPTRSTLAPGGPRRDRSRRRLPPGTSSITTTASVQQTPPPPPPLTAPPLTGPAGGPAAAAAAAAAAGGCPAAKAPHAAAMALCEVGRSGSGL